MDLGLTGKRALVTGATKGIGRAIAEVLLAEGASVAICARQADEVTEAVGALSATGRIVGGVADAADPDTIRAWVASSAAQLGGVDIYVHTTSAKGAKTFEAWKTNFDVDLMSLIHGVDAASEHLTANGDGVLVTIGTTAVAEHFLGGSNSYTAFKAAVTNWTLGQAQVLGAKGVRCNVVQPGPIFIKGGDWDRIKAGRPAIFEVAEKAHPLGHMGDAGDVADAVAFLVSPRAKHINGVNLTVDGGFLKRVDF